MAVTLLRLAPEPGPLVQTGEDPSGEVGVYILDQLVQQAGEQPALAIGENAGLRLEQRPDDRLVLAPRFRRLAPGKIEQLG